MLFNIILQSTNTFLLLLFGGRNFKIWGRLVYNLFLFEFCHCFCKIYKVTNLRHLSQTFTCIRNQALWILVIVIVLFLLSDFPMFGRAHAHITCILTLGNMKRAKAAHFFKPELSWVLWVALFHHWLDVVESACLRLVR